jgi:hypothetical protein
MNIIETPIDNSKAPDITGILLECNLSVKYPNTIAPITPPISYKDTINAI